MARNGYDRYIETVRESVPSMQADTSLLHAVNGDLKRFLQEVREDEERTREKRFLTERGFTPLSPKGKTR